MTAEDSSEAPFNALIHDCQGRIHGCAYCPTDDGYGRDGSIYWQDFQ